MKYYRFQTINKLTLQNLTNQKNWVADPYEFNDPFEFSLIDRFYLNEVGEMKQMKREEITKLEEYKNQVSELGVVCYSSDFYNNLLWAHYADNHNGMCLVFDVSSDKEKLYKVEYQERFPEIDLSDNAETHIETIKIVTTKSLEWKYEQEYRQVYIMKNMLCEYPGELVEIIFGCRTPFDDIKMVANIAVNKKPDISISKMNMARNEYQLGKVTLGDNMKIPDMWKMNIKI